MKHNDTVTAVVDFLLMTEEEGLFTGESETTVKQNIKKRREAVIRAILEDNKLVKHKKHADGTFSVDRSKISVIFEKIASKKGRWTVSVPNYGTFTYEEVNSEIKKDLTGSLTALERNNHIPGTEGRDWLASIAVYLYLSEEEGRLLTFVSFLARNFDIIINVQADVVMEVIYKIITWQGDDFREHRRKIVRSSIPLFIQSELAKGVDFDPENPQSIALFTSNLDSFSIRKEAYNEIENIERECALSGYTKNCSNILDERILQAESQLQKSLLEGIKFARQGNQLVSAETIMDEQATSKVDLINPDVEVYFYEIIKHTTAYSLMNVAAKAHCLTRLIAYAEDFTPSKRLVQEFAILTLVYILYERFEFPVTKQAITPEKVFKAAYGKVTYSMMDQLFDVLNEQSGGLFMKIIRTAYDNAVKKNKQPLYFFYYHKVIDSQKSFIRDCHLFRVATREGGEDNIPAYIESAARIFDSKEYVNFRTEDKECLYAMQSFFYGLANIARISEHGKKDVLRFAKERPDILCRLIATDYYTRKSVFDDKNTSDGELSDFIRSGNFYLLCGPTRLVCALDDSTWKISFDDLSTYSILKETLQSDYRRWLAAETGRYKILLGRKILTKIEDFDYLNENGKHCLANCQFLNETDFLLYDNVDILAENKKLIEIKEINN